MNRKEIRDTLNEIRFLASIRHPRIVGFYEVFQMQEDHAICMVLEFCAHGDLAQEVDKHRKAKTWFPEPRLWRYLAQVLEALKVLHERGIVHRDVKAANCFLGEGDTVKLGDMNISKRMKDGALLQTQTGTPYYMSPEIWANQPYGPPSDIWSLGVLLYELAALRKPFTASSFPELRRKVTAGVFPPLKAQRYSAPLKAQRFSVDLARALALLLRTAADQRPEAWELLDSSLVQSNLKMGESDQEEFEVGEAVELLQTIKIPRTFEELADRLPKACYPDLRPNSPDKWPAMDRARSLSPGARPRHGPGYDPPDSR
eukprot:CAMPEP_0194745858 /NCGR_PEP_ID=MMETSP0296-20130528/101630_1 /TAXON_ID=39354 /ORGANISM="Heterosigma akashiwo, Strain CCMP2393" /LENGTH=314 /DNA_ID=CAMNT_0039658109 /DNA_START=196 /DNA_END=1136 /DNA_ORIENTATION=+